MKRVGSGRILRGLEYIGLIGITVLFVPVTGRAQAPTIKTGGIVPNDGSASTVQPGSWISIFGTNLASGTTTWNSDFPTTLGGTSVKINNKPAYLWYASPGQINLQAPDDTATGSVTVMVTTAAGTGTSTVTLAPVSPSFSLLDGKHVTGIILRSDGSGAYGGGTYDIVGPTGTSLGYATVAAKPGDNLELFGVGFGPTNPAVPAGKAFSGAAPTANSVQLYINGVPVTPAFAGLTGPGLDQIRPVSARATFRFRQPWLGYKPNPASLSRCRTLRQFRRYRG
jgi:uncharacterized protein (TIGR03437 family)